MHATAAEHERVLQVSQAELKSLKPGKAVYVKRGNVLFLSTKEAAQQRVADQLQALHSPAAGPEQQR